MNASSTSASLKNKFPASHGGQEENIELINVINFVEQTMTTLSSYGKRFKTQISFYSSRTSNWPKYKKIL